MTKRQLIADIRKLNTAAAPQFLAQFDDASLDQYLKNLLDAQARRVRLAGWVRPAEPKVRMVC